FAPVRMGEPLSSCADPKATVAIAKDSSSTQRQRHPMKRIVGHRLANDSTDAPNSNYEARPTIALRHLAAPADWCRQITGWGTGRPLPQARCGSDPHAAVDILVQGRHNGAEASVIAI